MRGLPAERLCRLARSSKYLFQELILQFPSEGLVWLVICPLWQARIIDGPKMPACPSWAALIAATEKPIKWPYEIEAKRLKFGSTRSHREFGPVAASFACFIRCCFYDWMVPPTYFQRNYTKGRWQSTAAANCLRCIMQSRYQIAACLEVRPSLERYPSGLNRIGIPESGNF
jgi:hypothetical protein